MSGAPDAGSDGTQAQGVTPIAVPRADVPAKPRTQKEASDALDARVQARFNEAEGGERDEHGRYLPKAKAAKVEAKFPDGEKAPEAKVDAKDAKPAEKPAEDVTKLKADHEKATAELATTKTALEQAKKSLAEWDETAERVVARMDRQDKLIAYLQGELQKAERSVDPQVVENLTLHEQIAARKLADDRAAQAKADAEKAQREQEKAASLEALRGELFKAMRTDPLLAPPYTEERGNLAAADFWNTIGQAIKNGATNEQIKPFLATAPAVLAGIKAKLATPAAPPVRTLRSVATGASGEKRDLSEHAILDKWNGRLKAATGR